VPPYPQAKARFTTTARLLVAPMGWPRLIVDGRFSHAGDFLNPGSAFLYIAGHRWLGQAATLL